MNGHYILDENKQPVQVNDFIQWAKWFQTTNRTVAKTRVGDINVSTVFLGVDHNFRYDGRPILWETMVFSGPMNEECERYTSFEEAEWGHEQMVKRVLALQEGDRERK